MNADKALEIRVPLKAGSKLVAVAFTDSTPTPLEGAYGQPGIDKLLISGPFNGKPPEDTSTRRRIFICRPSGVREEEPCARPHSSAHWRGGRTAGRSASAISSRCWRFTVRAGRRAISMRGSNGRSKRCCRCRSFCSASNEDPANVKAGQTYRVSDLELASRLSFFLWRSLPDDDAARGGRAGAAARRSGAGATGAAHAGGPARDAVHERFRRAVAAGPEHPRAGPDGALFAGFNDTLRKAMVRETELFFESQVREDRPIPELLRADYTYLNEQLARHYGVERRLWEPVSARDVAR